MSASRRRTRPRHSRGESCVGQLLQLTCGPIGHGGFTVARSDEGRVVFVRHSLPGERVVAEVTEGTEGDKFWRADAIEVLEPSPDRVVAPCEFSGAGGCGGCDFQHVSLSAQRQLKAHVSMEQLRRLAKLDWDVEVEAVDETGLGWRTQVTYVPTRTGFGLRKHRSHDLVEVDECLIATPQAQPGASGSIDSQVRGVTFKVPTDGFWQRHKSAPEVLTSAVLAAAQVQADDVVFDLYSGVGLFARFLAEAGAGSVHAVEGASDATKAAELNLAGLPVEVITDDVARWLTDAPEQVDVVVLDPPRAGAKARVIEEICARSPRRVVHVACDPASLARDVELYATHGYHLSNLRAFDLFPMTHHVECVATLEKS